MGNWLFIVMGVLLLVAAVEDIKEKKVHRVLLALLVIVGVVAGIYACIGQSSNLWSLSGGLLIGLCMIGFSLISGGQIGIADGIIIAAIGLICGARDCLVIISIASMGMALLSIVLLIIRKGNRHTRLPFVPALLIGYCITGWVW